MGKNDAFYNGDRRRWPYLGLPVPSQSSQGLFLALLLALVREE